MSWCERVNAFIRAVDPHGHLFSTPNFLTIVYTILLYMSHSHKILCLRKTNFEAVEHSVPQTPVLSNIFLSVGVWSLTESFPTSVGLPLITKVSTADAASDSLICGSDCSANVWTRHCLPFAFVQRSRISPLKTSYWFFWSVQIHLAQHQLSQLWWSSAICSWRSFTLSKKWEGGKEWCERWRNEFLCSSLLCRRVFYMPH